MRREEVRPRVFGDEGRGVGRGCEGWGGGEWEEGSRGERQVAPSFVPKTGTQEE